MRRFSCFFALVIAVLVLQPANSARAQGDPARGKQLAVQCFACHGEDGNSPSPVIPKIGGQHEPYLLLALQAYVTGTRADSLMRGAVLDKSEQELQDIVAYFAAQTAPSTGAKAPAGGPPGPGGPGGVVKFDHGERMSQFTSMLARASSIARKSTRRVGSAACGEPTSADAAGIDGDGDGLADAYDAAPDDPAEFVADNNGDGRYEICNIHQLQAIATLGGADGSATPLSIDERLARSYQLVTDLDASGIHNFQPIGNCGPTGNCMRALGQFGFAGRFDGQGHVIRNLIVSWKELGGVSLFGVLAESGIVMNLMLENAVVEGRAGTGGMVGSNFGVVYNGHFSGNVSGGMAIGGLVGGSGGLVYNSSARGTVTGQQAVGGLVGDMTGAVYYSVAYTTVSGQRGIGGLVGLNTFGTVLNSRAAGAVTGNNDVGGLVGVNTDAKVKISYATGAVVGEGNNIGGLVGFNSLSTVRNSYATGTVTGADAVGGLVGRNNGVIRDSYATAQVIGPGQTGAIVGVPLDSAQEIGTYSVAEEIDRLDGETSGWAPLRLPVTQVIDCFCDRNLNGYIEPSEQVATNYIWDFGDDSQNPAVRCAVGGVNAQRKSRTGEG
jgi:cytochrome c553